MSGGLQPDVVSLIAAALLAAAAVVSLPIVLRAVPLVAALGCAQGCIVPHGEAPDSDVGMTAASAVLSNGVSLPHLRPSALVRRLTWYLLWLW